MKRVVLAAFLVPIAAIVSIALIIGGGGASLPESSCGTSGPSAAGEPALVKYYIAAAAKYDLGADGYAYLAAINDVETKFGTDVADSSAGAEGWMQFEPSTWDEYEVNVSDPGAPADPDNPEDAIYTAARYLKASGAPGSWSTAIYGYNHVSWYVDEVEALASSFTGTGGLKTLRETIAKYTGSSESTSGSSTTVEVSNASSCSSSSSTVSGVPGKTTVIMADGEARPAEGAPEAVQEMVQAGDRLIRERYSYGGGYCVAAMNQTTPDPGACPGDEENGGPGYDCASSTSYVLWGGGLKAMLGDTVDDSGTLESKGVAGKGKWVTFYASAGHAFIDVDGAVMDTVYDYYREPPYTPSTGPRWRPSGDVKDELTEDSAYTGTFVARHPNGL